MDLVVAILGILMCLAGMYREGYKSGREEGYDCGAQAMLEAFADGTIRIENGHLLLSGASFRITDLDGNAVNDIDLSKMDIRETEK